MVTSLEELKLLEERNTVPYGDKLVLHLLASFKRPYGQQEYYLSENRKYRVAKAVGYDQNCQHKIAWLAITALDSMTPLHDWRDMQTIKNQLCGKAAYAVEIYPAESDLIDANNNFHLWVWLDGYKPPFGFRGRIVVDPSLNPPDEVSELTPQRSFDQPPKGAVSQLDAIRSRVIQTGASPFIPATEAEKLQAEKKAKDKRRKRR